MIILTIEEIRKLFYFDFNTGKIYWAVDHGRWGNLPKNIEAGCLKNGYRWIRIGKKNYFGHHIAWALWYGEWANSTLDHLNGIRDDNRPENLRIASVAENNQNQHNTPSHNTSGIRGVSWDAARNKWTARISLNGKSKNLGRFDTIEIAENAYLQAKMIHHPFSTGMQK